MYDKQLIYSYVLDYVKSNNLRYETHEFPSGAIMVDIWKGKDFYVIQIENKKVGVSMIDEPDFSTVADEYYTDFKSFKKKFEKRLN